MLLYTVSSGTFINIVSCEELEHTQHLHREEKNSKTVDNLFGHIFKREDVRGGSR